MDRSTIELLLPDSKAKVTLYEFFTGGDFRLLQKKLLESTKVELVENARLDDISASALIEGDDLAVKLLIKEICIDDGIVQNKDEFVYNLSIGDSNLLYEKVREITKASNLTPLTKKK